MACKEVELSRRSIRSSHLAGALVAGAAGAAATVAAARSALARWEGSHLSAEELSHEPGAEELRIPTRDGAQLSAVIARAEDGVAGDDSDQALFVLAHGWTNDRRIWAPVARRLLALGHHVACYDHRGHGGSTIGSSGLTLEALAEDMWRVLDHLDARDAVVAGHSMGGMTAQALATSHPQRTRERVGAIVLVATACDGVGRNRLAERVGPHVIAHPHLDRAMQMRNIGPFLVRGTVGREASRSHLDQLCEMFVATPPHVRTAFLESMSSMDLTEGLPKVEVPVTVVAGERDNLLPRRHSHRIAGLVPGSRLVEISHAGHMLPIEAPEQVASLLHEAAHGRHRTATETRTETRNETGNETGVTKTRENTKTRERSTR